MAIRTTYKYKCDLDKGTLETSLRNSLMQADALADAFAVTVQRNGADVDISGMTVYGYLYANATKTTVPLKGAISGSTATVILSEDCYAVPGYASLMIQLHDGDVRHTVLKVDFAVTRTGGTLVLDGDNILPTLAELLGQIAAMEQATAEAREATAVANQAAENVEEFKGEIQGDLAAFSKEIGEIRTHTRNIFEGGFEQGTISHVTGADDNDMAKYYVRTNKYIPVDTSIVAEDNQCYIMLSYTSYMNAMRMAFYDENKAFISMTIGSTSSQLILDRKDKFFIVPQSARYIRFSIYGGNGDTHYTPADITDVQVEYGYTLTEYVKPYTVNDETARAGVAEAKAELQLLQSEVDEMQHDIVPAGATINLFGGTYLEQGNIASDGSNSASLPKYYVRCNSFVHVDADQQYALSFVSPTNGVYVFYYDAEHNFISQSARLVSWMDGRQYTTRRTFKFETPENCAYIRFVTFGTNGDTQYTPDEVANVQLEQGTVATDYIPHTTAIDYAVRRRIEIPMQYACGRILCIGDSLTEGHYAVGGAIDGTIINENYPYYLGRMLNAEVTNAGISGTSPSKWLAAHPDYDFASYDTVIIWLGTNGGLSADDISVDDTEANAYNTLIQSVKTSNPTCKIILATVFATGELRTGVTPYSVAVTNSAIRALADTYGTDLVDMSGLGHLQHPELHSTSDTTHFTKGGNIYVAARFVRHMAETFNVGNVEFGLTVKR